MSLTERDLDLIEVALESAISATSFSLGAHDDTDALSKEYRTALDHVRAERASN